MRIKFKKKLAFLFLVSPLLLATCQKSPTGPQGIEDVYPLAVGNYWVYEGKKILHWFLIDVEIREEIIGSEKLSDGNRAFVKRIITSYESSGVEDSVISYLQFVEDELREYSSKDYTCKYNILLKLPLQPGDKWFANDCFCPVCPLVAAFEDSVDTTENVSVPAGEFINCFRIVNCNCPASIVTGIRWLEPNLGITKFMVEAIWGTETYVLKEYRVR